MTAVRWADPLIDRDALLAVMTDESDGGHATWPDLADAVLDYLRSVLTPETLNIRIGRGCECRRHTDGVDLHRRIFGEE